MHSLEALGPFSTDFLFPTAVERTPNWEVRTLTVRLGRDQCRALRKLPSGVDTLWGSCPGRVLMWGGQVRNLKELVEESINQPIESTATLIQGLYLKTLVTYPRHETLWSEDPILIFEETWQKEVNSYLRNERCVAHHCSKRKHQNISTIGIIFEAWLRRGMCIAGCHDMLSLLGSWVGVLYLLTYIILLNINMFVIVCILLYVHAIFLDVFLNAFVQWKSQFQRSKHNLMAWRRKPLLQREAVISGG